MKTKGVLPRLIPFAAALMFCIAIVGAPARATIHDHPAEFCAGSVIAMSAPVSLTTGRTTYRIDVATNGGATGSGTLTLITDRSAYRATFAGISIARSSQLAPLDVTLPTNDALQVAYVDSIGIDGAAPADCPTQVDSINDGPQSAGPVSSGTPVAINATFLQVLPALACGKAYIPVRAISLPKLNDFYASVAKNQTAVIKLWLDSNGILAGYKILKSSGDDTIDIAATIAARGARFAPAQFLCVPVIGTFTLYLDYELR
jgi:TonB family protein